MIATSSRSLFPATTTIELSEVFPEQSRWIFGGSTGRKEPLWPWLPNTIKESPVQTQPASLSREPHWGHPALTLLGYILHFDFWKEKELRWLELNSHVPPSSFLHNPGAEGSIWEKTRVLDPRGGKDTQTTLLPMDTHVACTVP